jgi:hypothetical protein
MAEYLADYGNTEGPLGFPMADRQARMLETLLKSLPRAKEHEYRHRVLGKSPSELNPGERSDVSWISTESVDRSGEVVVAKGMNDAQYQSNPLVTLGHNYRSPPVGKSLWRKRVKDGDLVGIKAKTRYPERPDSWDRTQQWPPDAAFALVQAGLLAGKSIGFLPLKVHFPDAKEAGKNEWPQDVLVIDEWLLLEYACVYLPCNQDSVVEAVSKGLMIPDEFWQATGLDPATFAKAAPPPPGSPPPVVSFTALSEVEGAVQLACAGMDVQALVQKLLQEAYDRARGRV